LRRALVLALVLAALAAPAADATFPGTNGGIAFSRTGQGIWDAGTGGNGLLRRLSPPDAGCDSAPSYSASGAQLVFESCDPTTHTTGIWTMNAADGSGRTQVVASSGGRPYPQAPAFLPSGAQIAFQAGLDVTRLFTAGLNGAGAQLLAGLGYGPRFSAQGGLAYTVPLNPHAWCNSTELDDIWVRAPGAAKARRVTKSYGSYDPDWSPDGTHLVFTRDTRVGKKDFRLVQHVHDCRPLLSRASAYGQEVMTMDASGHGLRRLTTTGGSSPVFSPDGTQVAYERSGWIWIVNADGSNPHRFAQGHEPAWQPLPPQG
jgi:Tol biopolymer transport system component